VHDQHAGLHTAQQFVGAMPLAASIGTQAHVYERMTATLQQAHTADLRVGSLAILVAAASKGGLMAWRIGHVEERAINGHESQAFIKGSWCLRRTEQMTAALHQPSERFLSQQATLIAQSRSSCHLQLLIGVQQLQLMRQFVPHPCLRQSRPERHGQHKPHPTSGDEVAHPSRFGLLCCCMLFQTLLHHFRWVHLAQDSYTDLFTDLVREGYLS
jgi:hypothetical protein